MKILWEVVLPVFLAAGLTALAQERLRMDLRTLSRATFYLFSPALILEALTEARMGGAEFARLGLGLLLVTLVLWGAGELLARPLRLRGGRRGGFLIALLLMNAGNYGLPVNLFAFGSEGLNRAALYMTVSAVISNSLGVYLAARGEAGARVALRRVLRVPLVYAAALGLLLNLTGRTLPGPLARTVALLAQAAVPVMLAVLGLQLRRALAAPLGTAPWPALAAVTGGRLLIAPLLALAFGRALALEGLTLKVFVLESAMPSAVVTTILAEEFDADPPFVSLAVLISTLASLGTVTGWLAWLR